MSEGPTITRVFTLPCWNHRRTIEVPPDVVAWADSWVGKEIDWKIDRWSGRVQDTIIAWMPACHGPRIRFLLEGGNAALRLPPNRKWRKDYWDQRLQGFRRKQASPHRTEYEL